MGHQTYRVEGMTCASCVRRVEKALASSDGFYRLKGRYFLSAEGSGAGSHHARYFDIAVPVDPKSPAAVAQAAAQAITQLAQQIATPSGR